MAKVPRMSGATRFVPFLARLGSCSVALDGSDHLTRFTLQQRVYICTLDALAAGLCTESDLGRFITTPSSLSPSNSSIFTASVRFDAVPSAPQNAEDRALATGPYRYQVKKKGYYCVGHVPVVLEGASRNTSYEGVVDFENVFPGHLPASEYPKVFVSPLSDSERRRGPNR